MRAPLTPTLALLLALTLAPAAPAAAQGNPPDRERAALRRSQAQLQQLQQALDALQAEKSTLEQARRDAETGTAALSGERNRLRQDLARARDALQREQAEVGARLDAERQRHAQALLQMQAQLQAQAATAASAAEAREQSLREQLSTSQQLAGERQQANAALVQQLQAGSQALQDARRRITELHALGLQVLALYRDKGRLAQALEDEPVLGLSAVREQNTVELTRQQLDALLAPAAAAAER